MKLGLYIKDKMFFIVSFGLLMTLLWLIFISFKISRGLILFVLLLLLIFYLFNFFYEFMRKKRFYDELLSNIEMLDKSYLVLETIMGPDFYEGKILVQALYEINKSMCENVAIHERNMADFKDYIEMWIHEVKLPLAAIVLMLHNKKDKQNKKILEQVRRIESYVEQVLYYARCDVAHEDYLIREVDLKKVINAVALKNKDVLLVSKIDFVVEDVRGLVYTDYKWLEFIVNQIVDNSIKYRKGHADVIKIRVKASDKETILEIYDNGIGIPEADLKKVFSKSFTGHNGRIKNKSTGMGLFIAKSLAEKLGHKILIESEQNEFTRVKIVFGNNKYFEVVRDKK